MGMMKNYLLTLLEHCSEEQFGQDAIEHAIVTGALELTYNLPTDTHQIFDWHSACCAAPPRGEISPGDDHPGICRHCGNHATFSQRYDEFCEAWRAARNEVNAQSMDALQPLLEEVNRPRSLAQAS
jgi:hypothetical protein